MFPLRARPTLAFAPHGIWIVLGVATAIGGCRSAGPAPAPATAVTAPTQRAPWANALSPTASAQEAAAEPLVLATPVPGAPASMPTLAEIRIAPPARVIADLNALGRELPVRLGDQMIQSVLAKLAEEKIPIDAELLSSLASDRPLALILVSRGKGKPVGRCVAAPLARPADGARVAAKLGTPLSHRGGGVERRSAAGATFWTGVSDGALLLAQSYEELWSLGARALAAIRAGVPKDEVVVSVDPDAVRAATGTTWAEVAAEFRKAAEKGPTDKPGHIAASPLLPRAPRTSALEKMMGKIGDGLALLLSETAHVSLAVVVSASDGLILSAALEPRPGTPLAASAAAATGFTLDERLPVRDDRTGFTAWGSLDVFAPMLRMLLPGGPALRGGAPAPSPIDGFLSTFSGSGSCTFEVGESPPSSVCSLPLRPGTDARNALRRYAELVDAVLIWEADIVGMPHRPAPQIRKGVLEFERPLAATSISAEQYATVRAFMGGDSLKYAAAIRGDRLLQFQGGAPRTRLAAWSDGAKANAAATARPPLMSQALARVHGYNSALLMDPLVLVFTMFQHAADARTRQAAMMLRALPGLATTRTPLMFAGTSGPNLAYEFHIPVVTFDNIGKLIRPFAGMMGGAVGGGAGGDPGAVPVPSP
jgi:hypothetical protein